MQYNFHFRNKFAVNGTALALRKVLPANPFPVIVCIGSDLVSGDSLGPVTGTMIQKKLHISNVFLLGTLDCTVTAKEVRYLHYYLKATLKDRPVLTIDAAVGESDEIGLIRISDKPLRPGSGVQKDLGEIGNVSIQGIVAERAFLNRNNLSEVRMNMVYRMAEIISESVSDYIYNMC